MGFIIGILLFILFIGATILPWVNRSAIKNLQEELNALKQHLRADGTAPPQPAPQQSYTRAPGITLSETKENLPEQPEEVFVFETEDVPPALRTKTKKESSVEFHLGAKLPVWIGGIALALAGFYLVKYSIETGLLSPAVRTALGTVFGFALLFAGEKIRNKPGFANGTRIAQALTGAGIADLYVCVFVASNIYHFISPLFGFIGMGAVTAAAVVLALRHGTPIALLGMVGGFLTPALMESDHPSTFMLFSYLYFVIAGLFAVIRKQQWWWLGIIALLGGFAWVAFWLVNPLFTSKDAVWLCLFLLATFGTVFGFSFKASGTESETPAVFATVPQLNYIAIGGALLLMGMTVRQAGFGLMEWGLFGLLAAGGIAMTYFRQKTYTFVPWICLGVSVVMLSLWHTTDAATYTMVLSGFAALFALSGYALQWISYRPLLWAGQAVAAGLIFYLVAYLKLHGVYTTPYLWSGMAFTLAAVSILTLTRLMRGMAEDHPQKQHMLALYAAAATAFIAIGLTVELPREFLSVAIALEMLALAWIQNRINIPALRQITGVVALGFAVLLCRQGLLVAQMTLYSLFEIKAPLLTSIPVVEWPLFQLGLPAFCFLYAAWLLRQREDSHLVRVFEVSAVMLTGLAGYYITRHLLHPDMNILFIKAGFIERGIMTNIFFAFGLLCMMAGQKYNRIAIVWSGLVLGMMAVFRVGYFDLLVHNPLWHSDQTVGTWPVLNMLIGTYGLAIFWITRIIRALPALDRASWAAPLRAFTLLLAFVLISFEVRQFYHGEVLRYGPTNNAEIYTYSAVWLLFGLAMQIFGAFTGNKRMRVAALGIIVLTVGKVFLYDAGELTGLYRVFSFFGLGISLIGLSWFTTRFVLPKEQKE